MRNKLVIVLSLAFLLLCSLGVLFGGRAVLGFLTETGILTAPEVQSNIELDVVMPNEVTPTPTAESRPEAEASPEFIELITPPAQLAPIYSLRTSGMVELNFDDGDAVMGTISQLTRNDPVSDPVVFLIVPGYSIDVEYEGNMYFVSDRYDGKASVQDAAALAVSLYENTAIRLFVGPQDQTPAGFTFWKNSTGWYALKDWKSAEEPIRPEGLVCSEGIFVSATQKSRDLVAGEGEVIYGQFWTTVTPGYVVHVQVRQGETLTVPANWQGTYWVWSGDFKLGELDLQKRMIQATFKEVVDRDEIKGVKLLIAGTLPEGIDPEITSFKFDGETVTWIVDADDAWIK